MSDKRYQGNIISKTPVTPTGDAAKGVWSLAEAEAFKAATKWPTLPLAPTIGTATNPETGGKINVAFTASTNLYGGTLSQYTATSNPGSITGTSATSPITVSGLTNETSYTFTVTATTGAGTSTSSSASNSIAPTLADRGVFMAGQILGGSYATNTMDYINIVSAGNATDFGDLSQVRGGGGPASSSTRGLCMGGGDVFGAAGSENYSARIDYITIASTGNSSVFGNLSASLRTQCGGLSNSTRACQMFGQQSNGLYKQQIDYFTIASTGNASDFGDLPDRLADSAATFASPTRGMMCGAISGTSGNRRNRMDYITIASTGDSSDFGDMIHYYYQMGGTSSSTRGIFTTWRGSSNSGSGAIEYITIASTGNSTSFGDLTNPAGSSNKSYFCSATGNSTKGVIHEGYNNSAGATNVLSSVTIASTGNASDFGDLTVARWASAAVSASHGGL